MIDLKNAMSLALELQVTPDAAQDAATIDRWRAELPGTPLYKARVEGSLLLFRPAPPDVAKALLSEAPGTRPVEALRHDMVRACLLHPSMNDLAELAQHRPLLMTKLAIQCMAICGFGDDQDFKRADR